MVPVSQFIQTGLSYWMQSTGIEPFELGLLHEWVLRGTIVVASPKAGPAEARCEIVCDDSWQRRTDISLRDGPLNAAFRTGSELRRTMAAHRLKLSTFV